MATIATLAVSLTARTSKFNKGMRSASKRTTGFGKTITAVAAKLVRFAGVLSGVAGAGAFVILTKQSFAAIDATAKVADKLGLATEKLIGLRHAAQLSGVAINTFDMGLQRMTRRVAEAAQGAGEAKAAIAELGLSARQLAALSPDKQFMAIADAMEQVTNQADRVRLGFKLFDSEGVALINTLRGGSAALQQAQEDAELLGITFSRETAAAIERVNDALSRTKAAMRGTANEIAGNLAPQLERLANLLTAISVGLRGLTVGAIGATLSVGKWVLTLGAGAAAVPLLMRGIRGLVSAIRGIAIAGAAGGSAIALLLSNPVGWALLALGAGVAATALLKVQNAATEIQTEIGETVPQLDRLAAGLDNATAAGFGLATALRHVREDMRLGPLKEAANALKELERFASGVRERVKSPLLRRIEEMNKLNKALEEGLITLRQFERARELIFKDFEDATANDLLKRYNQLRAQLKGLKVGRPTDVGQGRQIDPQLTFQGRDRVSAGRRIQQVESQDEKRMLAELKAIREALQEGRDAVTS